MEVLPSTIAIYEYKECENVEVKTSFFNLHKKPNIFKDRELNGIKFDKPIEIIISNIGISDKYSEFIITSQSDNFFIHDYISDKKTYYISSKDNTIKIINIGKTPISLKLLKTVSYKRIK